MAHPTYEKLVATAIDLLERKTPDEVSSEMVLRQAGVSRGSLYHHFSDFSDLIEAALTRVFSRFVDENLLMISRMVEGASGRDDILSGIREFNRLTQLPGNKDRRFSRIRMLALSYRNPRLTVRLAAEQERLTQGYARLFRVGQRDGWLRRDFDPDAAAVFIQAYTLGRVVDDVSLTQVDPQAWNDLLMAVVEMVFGAVREPQTE
jgi:AcrR family transcriptional regulator